MTRRTKFIRSLFTNLIQPAGTKRAKCRSNSRRWGSKIENLEARELLATITVTNLGDGTLGSLAGDGEISLREAIHAANTNSSVDGSAAGNGADTIEFASGLTGTITLDVGSASSGELIITDAVTINGPGADLLTVDAAQRSRVIDIRNAGDVTLVGLTITGGKAGSGAGIRTRGTHLSITGIAITENSAADSSVLVGGGGILAEGRTGALTISGSTFTGNSSEDTGAAIASSVPVVVANSKFTDNSASLFGGAISGGTLRVTSSEFTNNSAIGGGAITTSSATSIAAITASTFSGNSAFNGGAILILGGAQVTVANSTLVGNNAQSAGGAFFTTERSRLMIINSTISGNLAGNGGGIYATNNNTAGITTTSIHNSIVTGNSASELGDDINNRSFNGSTSAVTADSSIIGDHSEAPGTTTTIENDPAPGVNWQDVLANDGTTLTLADNGGPTRTVALIAGSAAINSGSDSLAVDGNSIALATDQRGEGFGRFVGTVDVGSFEIQTTNEAPIANAGGPYSVAEGGSVQLDGSASSDPEGAPLTYEWDLDGDGLFGETGVNARRGAETGIMPTFNATVLDGAADIAVTVALRVTDDGGVLAETTVDIALNNVAPLIAGLGTNAMSLDDRSASGEVVLSGFVTDVGPSDTHAVVVDWGDGNVETIVDAGDLVAAPDFSPTTHQYNSGGVFTITVTVTDDDGGVATGETRALVEGTGLVDGTLYVLGTDRRDIVHVSQKRGQIEVRSRLAGNGQTTANFDPANVSSIELIGSDGNDHLHILQNIDIAATIDGGDGHDRLIGGNGGNTILGGDGNDFLIAIGSDDRISGGAGNDRVYAGGGNDIVLGGEGHDWIFAGTGFDLLVGGTGTDRIFGGAGDNLLIGGSTAYDDDFSILDSIHAEWSSSNSYADRIDNLRNGSGATDGNALVPGTTVIDDDTRDWVFGGRGNDWFFADPDEDRVWRHGSEELDELE